MMSTENEHEVLLRKHEVAKRMLKELDQKVAHYESLGIDSIMDQLSKYESLGEVSQLIKKHEGNTMEMTIDELKALLAKYQELGTVEEIQELVDKSEEMLEEACESKKKMESVKAKLESYTVLGTSDELHALVEQYSAIMTKTESVRIAKDLGLPEALVAQAITKMESVKDAEEFLVAMKSAVAPVAKVESSTPPAEVKAKVESVVEEVVAVATVVKHESSDNLASLRQICDKI